MVCVCVCPVVGIMRCGWLWCVQVISVTITSHLLVPIVKTRYNVQ